MAGPDYKTLTPEQAAKVLSMSIRRQINEEEVRTIAEAGDLLAPDGTLNLLEFAAFLLKRDKDEN